LLTVRFVFEHRAIVTVERIVLTANSDAQDVWIAGCNYSDVLGFDVEIKSAAESVVIGSLDCCIVEYGA